MSDVSEKLDKLDREAKNGDSRRFFSNLVVVKLGVQPKPYFPKLKDANGKTVVDEKGRAKRSEQQQGWQYTMAEYKTCEIIRFVTAKKYDVPRGYYVVSGKGYGSDFGSKWLDEDVVITKY